MSDKGLAIRKPPDHAAAPGGAPARLRDLGLGKPTQLLTRVRF